MKYLLVSPFTNASGSAIRFWNMALALSERGHDVVYADRRTKRSGQLHSSPVIRYYGCPTVGFLPVDILLSFFFYLAVFIRHRDCDLFYALKPAPNNALVALLAAMLGKKTVLDVDDLDYAYLTPGIRRNLFHFFFDLFPRYFHMVTFHTLQLGTYLRNTCRIPDERLHFLAQGISPEFLDFTGNRDTPPPQKSIVYVATLGITSDFGDLLPGLKTLCRVHPDLTFSIVGDGCRKDEFQLTASENGISGNLTFTGTLSHSDLPAFIARHRFGINYMRSSEVNRCRAILKIREYLACGCEVVCNNVGDVEQFSEYIHLEPDLDALLSTLSSRLAIPGRYNVEGREYIEKNYRWSEIIAVFQQRVDSL